MITAGKSEQKSDVWSERWMVTARACEHQGFVVARFLRTGGDGVPRACLFLVPRGRPAAFQGRAERPAA
ncbi:hypothetical protein N9L68_07715 [bacterium]|nr:hypothetical protein [bacterium]